MNWTAGPVTLGGSTMTAQGQYDTDVQWNGYLCPWLDAHGAQTVLEALARAYAAADDANAPTWEWDGEVLVLTESSDGGEDRTTTRYEPTADGLYPLGAFGWVWTEAPQPVRRCEQHPAYEADYCPGCGTARVIGGTR